MAPLATLTVKLEAQIAEFQAEFKEAAKSAEKFQDDFQATATKASAYGNLIARGVEIGIRAFGNLASAALENADAIEDMSKKTGLSIRSIQEFQEIAAQTGTSLESWTTAALNLGITLSKGGNSIEAGVKALGLSLKELNLLNQDEKFDRVTDALRDMDDQVEANKVGSILFQRAWKEVGGGIREDLDKLKAGTRLMTDDQVVRLAAANKTWEKFGRDVKIISGELLGTLLKDAKESWDAWAFVIDRIRGIDNPGPAKQLTPEQIAFDKSFNEKFMQQSAERTAAAKAAADAAEDAAEREKKAFEKAQRAAEAYRDSVRKMRDEFSGAALQADVKKLEDAFNLLTTEQLRGLDVQRRVGEAAEKLRQEGAKLSPELQTLAVRTEEFSKWLDKVPGQTQHWADSFNALRTATQDALVPLRDVATEIATLDRIQFSFDNLRTALDKPLTPIVDVSVALDQIKKLQPQLFGEDFGRQLGFIIGNAFRSGDVKGAVEDGASLIGATFGKGLAEKLTSGKNALTGWIGSMVSTALPLIGSLLGPLVGKIGDLLGSAFGNRGRDAVKEFAASFGGFDALHVKLQELGAEGERLWIKLTQGTGRNNPEQAAANIAEVEAALDSFGTEAERAATRLSGIGTAIDAINTKATAFASPFQNLLKDEDVEDVKAKLAAMGEVGQAEFERIGTFAAAAFAGLVKETGNALDAITQLGPTLKVLQDGVTKFGLTSTGTIDSLISMFALVNDAVTGPILQAIQTTGQIFAGLQEGGILTADLFQTVASDIGASFRELEAKGGDVAKAMALSQPVLQRLWEAQQIYGDITDETTQKLLKQAAEQGLVGAHMKDVNQKILDVLIAIADVFGAKIPEGMRRTQQAATETAAAVEREFGNIKIPNLQVDVDFNVGKLPNPDFTRGVEHLASGGIVRRPTLALIGEAGPEAVVPLSRLGPVSSGGGSSTVIIELDGRQIAEATVPHIPGAARRYVGA